MNIIAAEGLDMNKEIALKQIASLPEGIALFHEGSFDAGFKGEDYSKLDWLVQTTQRRKLTLVGERNHRVLIIKNGIVIPAQFYESDIGEEDYDKYDSMIDVSPDRKKKITSYSRICADGSIPYRGSEKADILFIPNADTPWKERPNYLHALHRRSINSNGHIVMSDIHPENNFIYSMKKKDFVGKEVKKEIEGRPYSFISQDI